MGVGIGEAVEALKRGWAVRRAGWNGKGRWLALADLGTEGARELRIGVWLHDLALAVPPFVAMRTATGELVPWLCSQTDLLASDWEVVPARERV